MSTGGGSGGFYRYRCKYYMKTSDCDGWVLVNGGVCTSCSSQGRESEEHCPSSSRHISREIVVPWVMDDMLDNSITKVIDTFENGTEWTLRCDVELEQSAQTPIMSCIVPIPPSLSPGQ